MKRLLLLLFGTALLSGGTEGPAGELKERATLPVAKDGTFTSLSFSPGGKLLAVATFKYDRPLRDDILCLLGVRRPWSCEGRVTLWNTATGKKQSSHLTTSEVHAVAFSPDGRVLARAEESRVLLLELRDGALREKSRLEWPAEEYRFVSMAFSPDGKALALGTMALGTGVVKLWDVNSGKERAALKDQNRDGRLHITSVAFSPDGKILASRDVKLGPGLSDKEKCEDELKLWDLASGKVKANVLKGSFGCSNVAFSPDGKFLALGGRVFDEETNKVVSGAIKLWDTTARKERAMLKAHKDRVWHVAFSADSNTLASGSVDTTVKLWDVPTGKQVITLKGHSDPIRDLAFSPDGKTLATAGSEVKLWDVAKLMKQK
jgi:WD40 repeat protein